MLVKRWLGRVTLGALSLAAVPAMAADSALTIEIPELSVAEYHRPYVAAWIMQDGSREVTNVALWYQMDSRRKGEEWLKDLRQWWRRSGRSLEMPVDGFTGATRAPGLHRVELGDLKLSAGKHTLYVEASREVGGRELLKIPFVWPANQAQTMQAKGESELGLVELKLTP